MAAPAPASTAASAAAAAASSSAGADASNAVSDVAVAAAPAPAAGSTTGGASATAHAAAAAATSAASAPSPPSDAPRLTDAERKAQIGFFSMHLKVLPDAYAGLDTSRMTLVYFSVAALHALGAVDTVDRAAIVEWIYNLQVLPDATAPEETRYDKCGFKGSPVYGDAYASRRTKPSETSGSGFALPRAHVAMTYTALATLLVLGDDLSRVHKDAVVLALRKLQKPSGSFMAVSYEPQDDMRFLYCACAVSYMLRDWRGIDVERAAAFVARSQAYDGAFGLAEGLEGHGGSTFCALASLWFMGRLSVLPKDRVQDLVHWCVSRQVGGFQGRPNKDEDTCYSHWIGGSLWMLGHADLVDATPLSVFIFSTMNAKYGGFAKQPGAPPDLLHAYFSLVGLAHAGYAGIGPIFPPLGIGMAAVEAADLTPGVGEDGAPMSRWPAPAREDEIEGAEAGAASGTGSGEARADGGSDGAA